MAMRTPSARHWRAALMRFSPSRSILGCCAAKSTRGSNELPDRVTCHCAVNTERTGVLAIARRVAPLLSVISGVGQQRLVKATLGEGQIVLRRIELCLPFSAFREQTIALR